MAKVLVTGGSGFIAGHMILRLLAEGHEVRATLRATARADDVRAALSRGGRVPQDRLGFVEADLMADGGWARAVAGCDQVLHVASPFPLGIPADENDLIAPARDGTLRVLRAARNAGVRRVVLTSSFAAIGYGHGPGDRVFTEADWTDPAAADVQPYMKSKTLAERAAWEFVAREGGGLELAVVNPVGVFGPVLGPDLSSSVAIIRHLLDGFPAVPRIFFGVVDVRDVADLHLRVLTAEAARGQRFLATGDRVTSLFEIATILRRRLGSAARRAPAYQVPDRAMRLLALVSARARAARPHLGVVRRGSNEKARHLLGWQPRPLEETIVDTAESLLRLRAAEASSSG